MIIKPLLFSQVFIACEDHLSLSRAGKLRLRSFHTSPKWARRGAEELRLDPPRALVSSVFPRWEKHDDRHHPHHKNHRRHPSPPPPSSHRGKAREACPHLSILSGGQGKSYPHFVGAPEFLRGACHTPLGLVEELLGPECGVAPGAGGKRSSQDSGADSQGPGPGGL